jgi:hypothetical protein
VAGRSNESSESEVRIKAIKNGAAGRFPLIVTPKDVFIEELSDRSPLIKTGGMYRHLSYGRTDTSPAFRSPAPTVSASEAVYERGW